MMNHPDRYSRQTIFPGIGPEGQSKLSGAFVVLVGCGALGTVVASALVRAGVGRLRVVDRDFIEYHNLQRQVLFTERDIEDNLPKATAAERHLREANSDIEVEGVVADFNQSNAEKLAAGADVLVDGLDNFETRFLINDVALKLRIPWVYGGAIASTGMTATFLPDEPPCFRCLMNAPPPGAGLTCDTAGVVNAAPWIVGSLEASEVIKLIVGTAPASRDLLVFDLWDRSFQSVPLSSFVSDGCPACAGKYEFLTGPRRTRVTSLCGQNAVQIWNLAAGGMRLADLKDRLAALGPVEGNDQMVRFPIGEQELVVFYDGRAIVRGTRDETLAKALYTRYVGM
jgi:molybdopterin/thiamine biosynthesis adenylyltransferase